MWNIPREYTIDGIFYVYDFKKVTQYCVVLVFNLNLNENMACLYWRYIRAVVGNICLVCFVVCDTSSDVNGDYTKDLTDGESLKSGVFVPVSTHTAGNEEDDEYTADYYGLQGAQHEFRFEISPGATQCVFQHMKKGAQFIFTFQVNANKFNRE